MRWVEAGGGLAILNEEGNTQGGGAGVPTTLRQKDCPSECEEELGQTVPSGPPGRPKRVAGLDLPIRSVPCRGEVAR